MSNNVEEDVELFKSIGLSEQKAKETLKNVQVSKNLKTAIAEVSGNITLKKSHRRIFDTPKIG